MQYRNSSLSQKCNKRRIGRWRDPFKVWMMNCFQSPGPSTPNVQWVLTTFFFQPRSPLSQTAWCGWNSGPPTLRVYMDLCLSLSLWHKRERERASDDWWPDRSSLLHWSCVHDRQRILLSLFFFFEASKLWRAVTSMHLFITYLWMM